jgi:ribosomal protein S18 acetylase RimI-like enzyme
MLTIRPLEPNDYPAWLPLWLANNHGQCAEAITAETWRRLNDPASDVHGLAAFSDNRLAGFVHSVTHPVTGHINPACYMQDLFVDPAFRQQGIGRKLVEALAAQARTERYARLYWLAEAKNEAAQKLYRSLGIKLDFTFHVLPL